MFNPISWQDYLLVAPELAFEMKLLALVDQYAVCKDINEMVPLAKEIDLVVHAVALCNRHYSTLQPGRYTHLTCEEMELAGYCLTVKAIRGEILYKVYHERNGRNVLTSADV